MPTDINFYVKPFTGHGKMVGFFSFLNAINYAKQCRNADLYVAEQVEYVRDEHLYLKRNWTSPMRFIRDGEVQS